MTKTAPIIREIVYLDRERIESYLSQLRGSLVVQSSQTSGGEKGVSGKLGFRTPVGEIGVGAEGSEHQAKTVTNVPAHAILTELEDLLAEYDLLSDAGEATPCPGQLAKVRGDTTFESWELLASLTDSIQGVADFAVKLWGKSRSDVRQQIDAAEKRLRKSSGVDSEAAATLKSLRPVSILLTAIEDQYLGDIKKVIKLFFQDQNHVRVIVGGRTFVGLLRRENLVASSMEELMFSYGTKPSASFDVLFLMAEYGGERDMMDSTEIAARFSGFKDAKPSLGYVQSVIREVGGLILEFAEELRRPGVGTTAFIVPLAVCREIKPKADVAPALLPASR